MLNAMYKIFLRSNRCYFLYNLVTLQFKCNVQITIYKLIRNLVERIDRIDRTQFFNNLLHLINLCLPIDVALEKRSIKYIWNFVNGENKLYGCIVKLSLFEKLINRLEVQSIQ